MFTVSPLRMAVKVRRMVPDAMPTESTPLPTLRCPGGPRMSSFDVKMLHKVPSNGYLKQDDLRFVLNLKLTHILMNYLSKYKRGDRLYLELGPGPGALTRSLLTQKGLGVLGIEIDPKYNSQLESIAQHTEGRFKWTNADVLDCDECEHIQELYGAQVPPLLAPSPFEDEWRQSRRNTQGKKEKEQRTLTEKRMILKENDDKWKLQGANPQLEVIANLPFAFTVPLAMKYSIDCSRRDGIYRFGRVPLHMFFQQEVAERICAVPSSANYGRPSVILQNFFHTRLRATFKERTYYPVTDVKGALLTLEPRSDPLVDVDAMALYNFVGPLFQARRGLLGTALHRFVPAEVAQYMLAEAKLSPDLSVRECSVTDLATLALIWQRFLEATNQPPPHDMSFEHISSVLDEEREVENHDFERNKYEAEAEKRPKPAW